MNSPTQIIESAKSQNIILYLKGQQLAYVSEEGAFPESLKLVIKENKDAIVEHLLQLEAELKQEELSQVITPVETGKNIPLSFAQQGLWFIDKLEGGSSQYNICAGFNLKGKLNIDALQSAFDGLIERHHVLRTVFVEKSGDACQVVQPTEVVDIPFIDISGEEHSQQQVQLEKLAIDEMAKTFDLQSDLMLRVKIIKISSEEHVMLFTMHHIVSDGWSLAVLVREFAHLYNQNNSESVTPLTPLDIQYGDYAYWQRQYFTDDKVTKQLTFWKDHLEQAPLRHSVPFDRPRNPHQKFAGDTHCWLIEKKTMTALKALAKSKDSTLFMVLYSAFSVLLGRWSQTKDVVIGSPIAGRTHPQVAPLIGYFLNSIIYRSQWKETDSFSSLLAQNRLHALEAYDNQDIPLDVLVDKMLIPRELSHSPFFQVMFTLQNNEKPYFTLDGLNVETLKMDGAITKYDLQMVAEEFETGIRFGLTYSTALFDPQSIEALAESLNLILSQVVDKPDILIENIKLCAEDNNSRPVMQSNTASASTMFTELTYLKPSDRTAIQTQTGEISYTQLNRQANQLARHLLFQDLPEQLRFLICYDDEIRCYIAMLAVLKIGGSFERVYPHQIEFIQQRMQQIDVCQYFLTCKSVALIFSQNALIFDEETELENYSHENLDRTQFDLNHPAIFDNSLNELSINYEFVIQQIARQKQDMVLTENSVLAILPGCTSFSSTDWLAGLSAGATLLLLNQRDDLSSMLAQKKVTHMSVTPSILSSLSLENQYQFEKISVVGGYSCKNLIKSWAVQYNVVAIANFGIVCNLCTLSIEENKSINLGYISQDSPATILFPNHEMTPQGAIGNLFIQGLGTTVEINKDLNSLYDTGIQVRQLSDGSIDLISNIRDGLSSDQVLLESFVTGLPFVSLAVVCHQTVYVCFNTCRTKSQQLLNDLKAEIRNALPGYMLPEDYIVIDEMPVQADRKVDRNLLSKQMEFWLAELNNPNLHHNKSSEKTLLTEYKTSPLHFDESCGQQLNAIAKQFNVEVSQIFSAMFSVAFSLNKPLKKFNDIVFNVNDKVSEPTISHVSLLNNNESKLTLKNIILNRLAKYHQTSLFRYVEHHWLLNKYEKLHLEHDIGLFDYAITFGSISNENMAHHGKSFPMNLHIKKIAESGIEGDWYFDESQYVDDEIVRLMRTFQALITMFDNVQGLSLEDFQQKLIENSRNRVRSVKPKFRSAMANK